MREEKNARTLRKKHISADAEEMAGDTCRRLPRNLSSALRALLFTLDVVAARSRGISNAGRSCRIVGQVETPLES
jgi:hypothetical protein